MGSMKPDQNQPKAAQTSPKQPKLVKNHLECNFYTLNPSQNYLDVFWAPLNLIKISPKQPKAAQSSPKQPKVAQSSPK